MNKFAVLVWFVITVTLLLGVVVYYEENPVVETQTIIDEQKDIVATLTNPEGGCKPFTLHWLAKANSTINVAMYAFTSDNMALELVSAKNRGLSVQVLFDAKAITSDSVHTILHEGGVSVKNYTNPSGNMILNFCLIDDAYALVGTYVWTEWGDMYDDTTLLLVTGSTVVKLTNKFTAMWMPSDDAI